MFLNDVAIFIIFDQIRPRHSELNSIVAIADELPHGVLDVLPENMETPLQREKIYIFHLEYLPHFFLAVSDFRNILLR